MSEPRPAIFPSVDAPATTPGWLESNRTANVRSLFQPEPEEEQQRAPSVPPRRSDRPSVPAPPPPPAAAGAARRQPEPEPSPQALEVPLDERALSRLPPPPGLGSLIPGGRSAPPPANDTGYAVLREHAEAFANAAIELAIARAALASLGDATAVTLRTSPDAFGPVCNALGGEDSEVRGVRVHVAADSSIPGLGCVVDGENMRIDATVSERLRAVRRAFEEERRKTAESSE